MGPLEAAGLILAILPIMMTAAGYRVSAPVTIASQKTKDAKYLRFYRLLHDELALLSSSLRNLVASLPLIQAELREQLLSYDSNAAKAWEEEIVEEALRERLGGLQALFFDSLQEVLRALEDIVSTQYIKVDNGELVGSPTGGKPIYAKLKQLRAELGKNKESVRERWRFTSKEVKLRKSLKVLNERNQYLERLLHQTTAPAAVQEALNTPTWTPPPRKICDLAITLHSSLVALSSESSNTQLQARLCVNVPYHSENGLGPTIFELYIMDVQGHWQKTLVHIDTDLLRSQPEGAVTSSSSLSRNGNGHSVERFTLKRKRNSATEMSSMERLYDARTLSDSARHSEGNTELLLNSEALWRIKSTGFRKQVPRPRTLHDLLDSRMPLKLRDRHRLAVILANACFNFVGSPWLRDRWSAEDVHFMHMSDGSADIKRPYLAVALDNSRPTLDHTDSDDLIHEYPPLLSLGIVLLELGISQPLRTRQLDDDLVDGVITANTDFLTALRVLEESVDAMHSKYAAAIDACLNCHFLDPDVARDFGDEVFRSLVYNNIVVPLEEELYWGWNDKPEDLWILLDDTRKEHPTRKTPGQSCSSDLQAGKISRTQNLQVEHTTADLAAPSLHDRPSNATSRPMNFETRPARVKINPAELSVVTVAHDETKSGYDTHCNIHPHGSRQDYEVPETQTIEILPKLNMADCEQDLTAQSRKHNNSDIERDNSELAGAGVEHSGSNVVISDVLESALNKVRHHETRSTCGSTSSIGEGEEEAQSSTHQTSKFTETAPTSIFGLVSRHGGQKDEVDEIMTVYSSADDEHVTMDAPTTNHLNSEIADAILVKIGPLSECRRLSRHATKALGALIKEYARIVRTDAKSLLHRSSTMFVRQQRQKIANLVNERLYRRSLAMAQPVDDAPHSAAPVPFAAKVNDWLTSADPDHDIDAIDNPDDCDDEESTRSAGSESDDDEPWHDLEAEPDMTGIDPHMPHIRNLLFSGPSWTWLVERAAGLLRKTSWNTRVTNSLLTTLITDQSKPVTTVAYQVHWDPLVFLEEQFGKFHGVSLREVITVTADNEVMQTLSCAAYIKQTWPSYGIDVLTSLETFLEHKQEKATEYVIAAGSSIVWTLRNHLLRALVTGPPTFLIDLGELLSWIGAACNTSTSPSHSCRREPVMTQRQHASQDNMREITVSYLEQALRLHDPASCWLSLFHNTAIASGFPVLDRQQSELGMEMDPEIMVGLSEADFLTSWGSKVLLKGFASMLIPISTTASSVLWHLVHSQDGSYLSYAAAGGQGVVDDGVMTASLSWLQTRRHFVGWTPHAQTLSGTKRAPFCTTRPPSAKRPTSGLAFDKLTISGGLYINMGMEFTRGKKDKPLWCGLSSMTRYDKILDECSRKFGVLYDTADRCAWMLGGLDILVHLTCNQLQTKDKRSSSGNKYCVTAIEDFQYSDGSANGAFHALSSNHNRMLELSRDVYEVWYERTYDKDGRPHDARKAKVRIFRVEDLVREYWDYLAKMWDHHADPPEGTTLKSATGENLLGWSFEQVRLQERPLRPLTTALSENGVGWLTLCEKVGACVLMADGLGPLIQPLQDRPLCSMWTSHPLGDDYMVVSVHTLKAIRQTQAGATKTNSEMARGLHWVQPTPPFHDCDHSSAKAELCRRSACDRVQYLCKARWRSSSHNSRLRDINAISDDAAVIFGKYQRKQKHASSTAYGATEIVWGTIGTELRSGNLADETELSSLDGDQSRTADSLGEHSIPSKEDSSTSAGHSDQLTMASTSSTLLSTAPSSTADTALSSSQKSACAGSEPRLDSLREIRPSLSGGSRREQSLSRSRGNTDVSLSAGSDISGDGHAVEGSSHSVSSREDTFHSHDHHCQPNSEGGHISGREMNIDDVNNHLDEATSREGPPEVNLDTVLWAVLALILTVFAALDRAVQIRWNWSRQHDHGLS